VARLVAALAAAGAALAAWVSCGVIAFRGPAGARIGVLPLDASSLALACAAGVVVLVLGLERDRGVGVAIAVSPLALLLLPWLPIPLPPAFLVWTGALASLVWLSVAVGLMAGDDRVRRVTAFTSPGRAVVYAAGLACILFSLAAWSASASIPGGDEPHYLVITQSLLYDHDLKIENNHARGDYRAYFPGSLPPDFRVRGQNGAVYSIHAPGVPALVLPAFALGGYRGVVMFLILLSGSACALAWWLAWRATGSMPAAWFGWAAVTLSAPFALESFTVYPDAPGAAAVLTGFWALGRAEWERDAADGTPDADRSGLTLGWRSWVPWLLHGAALAALPWMHTRFALLAAALGGLVLVRLARTPNPLVKVGAFLSVPAASALAWLGFFLVVYGTPDPTAPYGGISDSSLAFLPDGFGGLMFDQGFGLLATAPVLAVALAGFVRVRRLALEWLMVAAPYALAVGTYAMWWAGWSGPARFLVPVVLPLAIPAACAWRDASRGARATMIAALVVSAWLSAVMVSGGGGLLGYHARNTAGLTAAPWLEWASSVVDLPAGAPAFVPLPTGTGLSARIRAAHAGFAATGPWVICLGAAAMLVGWVARRARRRPETVVAATVLIFASAVMLAVSLVWNMHTVQPLTVLSAQMDALRRLAAGRSVVFDFAGRRRLTGSEAWNMRLESPISRDDRSPGPRGAGALATFAWVPAGSYVIAVRRHGAGEGSLMVDAGDDEFAILARPITAFDAGATLDLPVAVRMLTVRGDEGARDQVDAIELRPRARATGPVAAGAARHAARYGHTVVFFMDDRSSPEPTGFWAWGGRDSMVVFAADDRPTIRTVVLRNGAAENAVTIESGGWRQDLQLHPGEERSLDIPLEPSRGIAPTRIRSSTGFRPSEVDPNSRDTRFLGVFVTIPANPPLTHKLTKPN
jgi:hypothetical protein